MSWINDLFGSKPLSAEQAANVASKTSAIASIVGTAGNTALSAIDASKRRKIEANLANLSSQQQAKLQAEMLKAQSANERLRIILDYSAKAQQPKSAGTTTTIVLVSVGVVFVVTLGVFLYMRKK